jgi:RimJ/RimL family protein N-acetyltransferase
MGEVPMAMAVFTALETTRLRLRYFTDADLALFMAYRNDPEVARYQGWEGISEPEARAFLQEQKEVQPGVPGQWFQIGVPVATGQKPVLTQSSW